MSSSSSTVTGGGGGGGGGALSSQSEKRDKGKKAGSVVVDPCIKYIENAIFSYGEAGLL